MSAGVKQPGLIFDLDGTLVDSLQDIALSINLTRQQFGLAAMAEPDIIACVGDGAEALVRSTILLPAAAGAVSRTAEALAAYLAIYEQHALDHTRLMPGMDDLLDRLRGRRLGVITNKTQRLADRVLQGLRLRERFEVVLGGDALPRRKPDPLPILRFLEQTGLAPREAAMIGDGLNDVRAGRSAGVVTIAVSYGVTTRMALDEEQPDYLVDSVADLQALLT